MKEKRENITNVSQVLPPKKVPFKLPATVKKPPIVKGNFNY